MHIKENIAILKDKIETSCRRSGREPDDIKIIAVSKTKPESYIKEALDCGIKDFGENFIQEFTEKYENLKDHDIKWHFIGSLQTNKVKYLTRTSCVFHSLDRVNLAEAIQKRLNFENKSLECLIQVNSSREATKSGVAPEKTLEFVEFISRNCPNILIKGLMTIAENSDSETQIRNNFRETKTLFDEIKKVDLRNIEMKELSMGMSGDFDIAIEEGSTIIRIGSLIFGERLYV